MFRTWQSERDLSTKALMTPERQKTYHIVQYTWADMIPKCIAILYEHVQYLVQVYVQHHIQHLSYYLSSVYMHVFYII
jgi:hypothetical protein